MEKKNTNRKLKQKELVEEAQPAVNADEQIRSDNADPPHEQQDPGTPGQPVEHEQQDLDTPGQPVENEAEKQNEERPGIAEQFDESSDIDPLASFEQDQQRSAQDNEERLTIPEILPVLPLKDTVVYPFSVQPLGVGQERSIRLIDDVMRGDRLVVLVAQKSAAMEQAGPDDIFKIGTVARVGRMFRMPDGTLQIAVQGLERVVIGEFTQEKPYLTARVALQPDTQEEDNETEAIKRNVVSYFQRMVALVQTMPEHFAASALNLEEARQVVYVIATFVPMELEMRQQLLELDWCVRNCFS